MDGFTLDLPEKEKEKAFQKMMELLNEVETSLEEMPVYHGKTQREIYELFARELPERGEPIAAVLNEVKDKIVPHSTLNIGPYYQSYVMSCSNHAGFMGQIISTFFNQNATKWHLGSVSAELEQLVVRWIKAFMELPADSAGVLVSGGSAANLTCLTVARNEFLGLRVKKEGLYGQKPLVLYTSTEVHYCVVKAAEMLGLGSDYVRKIAVEKDLTIDLIALQQKIEEDKAAGLRPFCIVASAGTVNTGAIDPIDALADICDREELWLHIDGAYGGLAAGVPNVAAHYQGLSRADSIAVDPHKWLYVPFEAGCALFKKEAQMPATYSHLPDYLVADRTKEERRDFMEYGFQLSRSDKALKIWMTFKVLGAEKLKSAIDQDIEKARYLGASMEASDLFEVVATGPLSIVCYRFNPRGNDFSEERLEALNQQLLDRIEEAGKVFITATRVWGKLSLRSCFVNHRAQQRHLDFTFEHLRQLALELI